MSSAADLVILVDRNDRQIGLDEKLKVHREASLHRAFSVFLFDESGRYLLQQRVRQKYHSGGLWSNTCCSHPRPGESIGESAGNSAYTPWFGIAAARAAEYHSGRAWIQ